jgi:hypothetical protein
MMRPRARTAVLAAALATLVIAAAAGPAAAQTGSGTRTAAVLLLPGGGRAAGMAGAYAAATDVDALFYNPASAAWTSGAVAASYQRLIYDVGFSTAAAALRTGPVAVGLTLGFLDYGSIAEIVPEANLGGERGRETGNTLDAGETVARLTVAVPLLGGRLAAGASGGVLISSLAETVRAAPVFDAGIQLRVRTGLVGGVALRNAGGAVTGSGLSDAPLPTELRAGTTYTLPLRIRRDLDVHTAADLVLPLNDGSATVALGAEAVYAPRDGLAAALRAGYNGTGAGGVGPVHAGGGIRYERFAIDYAFQRMSLLGAVHRVGVSWAR